jgi:surface polysaccharide O-acyltransferase-like enzyme
LNQLIPFFPNKIYFPFSELSGYIGYYIAGYYFAKFNIRRQYKIGIFICALISAITTIVGTYKMSFLHGWFDLTFDTFTTPTVMVITLGVFLLFRDFASKLEFTIPQSKIIKHLSDCTFGIYLSHWMIISILNMTEINKMTSIIAISIPVMALLVMICSYIVTIILKRIPVLRKYVV